MKNPIKQLQIITLTLFIIVGVSYWILYPFDSFKSKQVPSTEMRQEIIEIYNLYDKALVGYEVITVVSYKGEIIWYDTADLPKIDSVYMKGKIMEAMDLIIAIEQFEKLNQKNSK